MTTFNPMAQYFSKLAQQTSKLYQAHLPRISGGPEGLTIQGGRGRNHIQLQTNGRLHLVTINGLRIPVPAGVPLKIDGANAQGNELHVSPGDYRGVSFVGSNAKDKVMNRGGDNLSIHTKGGADEILGVAADRNTIAFSGEGNTVNLTGSNHNHLHSQSKEGQRAMSNRITLNNSSNNLVDGSAFTNEKVHISGGRGNVVDVSETLGLDQDSATFWGGEGQTFKGDTFDTGNTILSALNTLIGGKLNGFGDVGSTLVGAGPGAQLNLQGGVGSKVMLGAGSSANISDSTGIKGAFGPGTKTHLDSVRDSLFALLGDHHEVTGENVQDTTIDVKPDLPDWLSNIG